MPYLIDGHNLIAHLPDLRLDDPDDEAKLVQKLIGFAARTKKRCVVVFDHGLPGGESRLSTGTVKVVFASAGKSADRVIFGRIRTARDPGEWVVVSSDNDVLAAARGRRMKTLRSEEFAALLQRPMPEVPDPGEAADVQLSPQEVEEWLALFQRRRKK